MTDQQTEKPSKTLAKALEEGQLTDLGHLRALMQEWTDGRYFVCGLSGDHRVVVACCAEEPPALGGAWVIKENMVAAFAGDQKRYPDYQNLTGIINRSRLVIPLIDSHQALRDALELILPMAKAYAAANPVGSNAVYVGAAETAIRNAEATHD